MLPAARRVAGLARQFESDLAKLARKDGFRRSLRIHLSSYKLLLPVSVNDIALPIIASYQPFVLMRINSAVDATFREVG